MTFRRSCLPPPPVIGASSLTSHVSIILYCNAAVIASFVVGQPPLRSSNLT